jgi:hypothetical protein
MTDSSSLTLRGHCIVLPEYLAGLEGGLHMSKPPCGGWPFPKEAIEYYVAKRFENWADSREDPVQVLLSLRTDAINDFKEWAENGDLETQDVNEKIEAPRWPYLEISDCPDTEQVKVLKKVGRGVVALNVTTNGRQWERLILKKMAAERKAAKEMAAELLAVLLKLMLQLPKYDGHLNHYIAYLVRTIEDLGETEHPSPVLDEADTEPAPGAEPGPSAAPPAEKLAHAARAPADAPMSVVVAKSPDVLPATLEKTAEAPIQPKRRRGRKDAYDWDEGDQYMKKILHERGDPLMSINAQDGWRSDADVGREVQEHIKKGNRKPDFKHTMKRITPKLEEWRKAQSEKAHKGG